MVKYVLFILALVVLVVSCSGETNLMANMPEGYDVYTTFNPKTLGLKNVMTEIQEALESTNEEFYFLEDLRFDVMDWDQWEDELGLSYGSDIGIVMKTRYSESVIAVYLPTKDKQAVENFLHDIEVEDYEIEENGNYIIIVTGYDEDAIEDFQHDLNRRGNLSENTAYSDCENALPSGNYGIRSFQQNNTVFGLISSLIVGKHDGNKSVSEIAVVFNNLEIEEFISENLPNGIADDDIKLPPRTAAFARIRFNSEEIADNWPLYERIFDLDDNWEYELFLEGLNHLGFRSIPTLLELLEGDLCIAVTDADLNNLDNLEDYELVFALSLADTEKMENHLDDMVDVFENNLNVDIDMYDDVEVFVMEDLSQNEYCIFIDDNILYWTFNINPNLILDRVSIKDAMCENATDLSRKGFLGACIDLMWLERELDIPREFSNALEGLIEYPSEFSFKIENEVLRATITTPNLLRISTTLLPLSVTEFNEVNESAYRNACRANIRTIASQQTIYYAVNDKYADNLVDLQMDGVVCPNGGHYIVTGSGYSNSITCPNGHGDIDDGIASWSSNN